MLLWAWSAFRRVKLFERDGSLGYGLLIGVLFAAEFLSLYSGLSFTTASRSVIFLYTSPFVVAIGAHLFVPGERLQAIQVVGLLCAFAGVVAAFADGLRLSTHDELIGDVMVLGAALFWGATTVVVKASRLAKISPNKTLFYQLAGSTAILPALSVLVAEPGVTNLTPLVLGALAYQILIVAFISYLAWFWLISQYPASKLAAFSFFTPLFGMMAGAVLLSERVTGILVLAMLLVGVGTYLVNRVSSRDTVSVPG